MVEGEGLGVLVGQLPESVDTDTTSLGCTGTFVDLRGGGGGT